MKIVCSDHAKIKIGQRKILISYISETLSRPDITRQGIKGRDEFYKKFIKLHLKVVAKKVKGGFIVITVHWVAKVPAKE